MILAKRRRGIQRQGIMIDRVVPDLTTFIADANGNLVAGAFVLFKEPAAGAGSSK